VTPPPNFETELKAAQAQIEAELKKSITPGANFKAQGELLTAAMNTTQKHIMQTFEQYQSSLKKLAEEMAEGMRNA
jgi:hypothetical protein